MSRTVEVDVQACKIPRPILTLKCLPQWYVVDQNRRVRIANPKLKQQLHFQQHYVRVPCRIPRRVIARMHGIPLRWHDMYQYACYISLFLVVSSGILAPLSHIHAGKQALVRVHGIRARCMTPTAGILFLI